MVLFCDPTCFTNHVPTIVHRNAVNYVSCGDRKEERKKKRKEGRKKERTKESKEERKGKLRDRKHASKQASKQKSRSKRNGVEMVKASSINLVL